MSALVATVPSPPVSCNVFAAFASFCCIYLTGFSIAFNKVPSVNLAGGFVFPSVFFSEKSLITSPSFKAGNTLPLSSPSGAVTSLYPLFKGTFPSAKNVSPSHSSVILVCSYSYGGYKTARNLRTTKSKIFLSSTESCARITGCSVGIIA